MELIGWELLKGIGRFFSHPLTYILPIAMFLLGYFRVRRERTDFNTKVYRAVFDVTAPILPSFAVSIILSVIVMILGLAVPFEIIALIGILTFLYLITGRGGGLSPAYTAGLAIILAQLLPYTGTTIPWIGKWSSELGDGRYSTSLILLALLLFSEGMLIRRDGKRHTSPMIIKSPRGKWLGAHRLQRLWFFPLLLFIPEGALKTLSFWPVVPIGENGLALFIIPMAIGARFTLLHSLPERAFTRIGGQICLLSAVTAIGSVLTFFYPGLLLYMVIFTIICRLGIGYFARLAERSQSPLFTIQPKGIRILGVLPESPAEKMGLKPGELIIRVNGMFVNNENDFYTALQKNSAYSKVEVRDINNEVRHTQSVVYDNEHHEIGVLLVREKDYPYTVSQEG